MSKYRHEEDVKTRENFSTDSKVGRVGGARQPNPLTGEGYVERGKGIRTRGFGTDKENAVEQGKRQRSTSKKHYTLYYCR